MDTSNTVNKTPNVVTEIRETLIEVFGNSRVVVNANYLHSAYVYPEGRITGPRVEINPVYSRHGVNIIAFLVSYELGGNRKTTRYTVRDGNVSLWKLLNRVRSGLEELKGYEALVAVKKQLEYEDGFRAGRMETELKNRCLEKLQYELKLVRLNKEELGRYRGSIPFNNLTLDEIQKVKTLINEFTTGGVKS